MTNDLKLTGTFVMRNCVRLGYIPLESLLSAEPMLDEIIICADPSSDDETMKLAYCIQNKFPQKTKVVEFVWPIGKVKGDGTVIGVASGYALQQATGNFVVNIQSDECWPTPLMEYVRDNWRTWVMAGYECFQFKVLNTEHNAQFFQGGEVWDGKFGTDVWNRGGLTNGKVGGAGYNHSFKMVKKCLNARFKPDAWSFAWDGFVLKNVNFSERWPIMHLHDFHRDHLIDIRQNAGTYLWTDQQYANYKSDANRIEATKDEWYNSPIWTETKSPFDELLPDVVKPLIGEPKYTVRWNLIS